METAYAMVCDFLETKFGKVPYFSIEHKVRYHPTGDSVEYEWSVYVADYDWHTAPTIDQAIALLDEEISPSSPGCIGVGV